MPKANQTAEKWRLGPCEPHLDPWGKGAWDSKCDLYDINTREKCPSGIGDRAAPQTFTGAVVVPPFDQQLLFAVHTPPCDRFALFVTYMKQIGGTPARPAQQVVQGNAPSPWVVAVQRGMDCVDEPSPATPGGVNYKPTFFGDFGLILQLFGTTLSTYWAVYAYQITTVGTDVGWQASFRVIADRIGCCPEGVQNGPNTTPID